MWKIIAVVVAAISLSAGTEIASSAQKTTLCVSVSQDKFKIPIQTESGTLDLTVEQSGQKIGFTVKLLEVKGIVVNTNHEAIFTIFPKLQKKAYELNKFGQTTKAIFGQVRPVSIHDIGIVTKLYSNDNFNSEVKMRFGFSFLLAKEIKGIEKNYFTDEGNFIKTEKKEQKEKEWMSSIGSSIIIKLNDQYTMNIMVNKGRKTQGISVFSIDYNF